VNHDLVMERKAKVKTLFKEKLGLEPFEDGTVYMQFLIPRQQEDKLVDFLKNLEAEKVWRSA
jgi:hypothetical protein